MSDHPVENVSQSWEQRKHADAIAIENRKLDIEQRKAEIEVSKVEIQAKAHSFTLMGALVPVLGTIIVGLAVALITMWGNLSLKTIEVQEARALQLATIELESERQQRKQHFDIIVQATKDVRRDIAIENLRFFVNAGILDDPDGKIRALANQGATPEFGTPPRVNDLTTSESGLAFLKRFLRVSLEKEIRSNGTVVIGYSHWAKDPFVTLENGTILDLTTDEITQDQADALLKHDLAQIEESINATTRMRLTQSQFDALVSFVANIGSHAFETSDVLRAINEGDFEAVPDFMRKWKNVSNVEVSELKDRRELEIALWSHEPLQ